MPEPDLDALAVPGPNLWAEELAAYERDVLEPEAEFLLAEDARHQRQKRETSERFARAFCLSPDLAPLLKVAVYSSDLAQRIRAGERLCLALQRIAEGRAA